MMQPARQNRFLTLLAGLVFGCLSMFLLIACLVVSLAVLAIRANASRWTGYQVGPASSNDQTGEAIFAQRCAPCHATGSQTRVGPGLAGLFSPGGPQLPEGVDYDGRLSNGQEINEANVAAWIRSGGRGKIGYMPAQRLTDEQMNRLIEYLQTLE